MSEIGPTETPSASGPRESKLHTLLVAPPAAPISWIRWDWIALGVGVLLTAWIFALKMRAFERLAYQDDMYLFVELATSWLDGRPFFDNHYGFHLRFHVYLLALALGVVVRPLGAPGVFLVLSVAAGTSGVLAARLLRALAVPAHVATIAGFLLVTTPLALVSYHDPWHGFHIEPLVPPFAIALAHAQLRRRLGLALLMALVVISIKEEMTLIVLVLSLVTLIESRARDRTSWNRASLATGALALMALPILVGVMKLASAKTGGGDAFSRLNVVAHSGEDVHSTLALVGFIARHGHDWLTSAIVARWLGLLALATVGLVALRPHYVPLALPLTITAWLVENDIQWVPRFSQSLAFSWVIAILAFASLWRLHAARSLPESRARSRARVAALALVFVASNGIGHRVEPWVRDVWTLSPWSPYTPDERAQADELFAIYRRDGRSDEPVVASPWLYRYAHDRFPRWWYVRREPPEVWILWDDAWQPQSGFGIGGDAYTLIGRRGRFSLWRRKA